MRWTLLLLCLPAAAQHQLFACGVTSRNYVVGARLLPSGLFQQDVADWVVRGFPHPQVTAIDFDRRDPSTLYLSAGNGVIRAANRGRDWKVLTNHLITELRDIAVDPNAPGHLYAAHTAGLAVSRDAGATWDYFLKPDARRPFVEAVRVDRTRAGHVVAGGERGLNYSADGGRTWKPAGAAGFAVMHIEQSPHDPREWFAVTMQGGIFRSMNGGASFENLGDSGVHRNLYDIAFDPLQPGRIAVAGWGPGVMVTEDSGRTWEARNARLPRTDVWSVAWDPVRKGRLYASVHEEEVVVSDDAGRTWHGFGLPGSVLFRMKFIPEVGR